MTITRIGRGAGAALLAAVVAGVAWHVAQQADPPAGEPGPTALADAPDAVLPAAPADTGEPTVAARTPAHDTPAARMGAASAALAAVAQRGAAAPAPTRVFTAQDLARHPQEAGASGEAPALAAGQRVRVAGELAERLHGEAGVTVLVLATEAGAGLHLVWSPAHVSVLAGMQAGSRIQADCLVQGEVLGRWILADCRT